MLDTLLARRLVSLPFHNADSDWTVSGRSLGFRVLGSKVQSKSIPEHSLLSSTYRVPASLRSLAFKGLGAVLGPEAGELQASPRGRQLVTPVCFSRRMRHEPSP